MDHIGLRFLLIEKKFGIQLFYITPPKTVIRRHSRKYFQVSQTTTPALYFLSEDSLQFLQLFLEALTCPSRKLVQKLIPRTNSESCDYLGHYEEKMPPLTQHLKFRSLAITALSSNQSIMINPNCTLFQYPIMPPKQIISDDKIGCEELLPLHTLDDSSNTILDATTPNSFVHFC